MGEMQPYGIKIGTVKSHGKARITGYGRGYPVVTGILNGFSKATHHWDETNGVMAAEYPMSPEERTVFDVVTTREQFNVDLKANFEALVVRVAKLEAENTALKINVATNTKRLDAVEAPK